MEAIAQQAGMLIKEVCKENLGEGLEKLFRELEQTAPIKIDDSSLEFPQLYLPQAKEERFVMRIRVKLAEEYTTDENLHELTMLTNALKSLPRELGAKIGEEINKLAGNKKGFELVPYGSSYKYDFDTNSFVVRGFEIMLSERLVEW